jgi:thiol-disulfide isomerase/thioredoxin
MRYSLTLAFGLTLAASHIVTGAARQQQWRQHVPIAHAAAATPQVMPARPWALAAIEHEETATAQTHRASRATREAPVVREVDLDGLKKLLQRGAGEGARPLLVNFWATWCEPCREEFPDLVRINRDYDERRLDFITVSLDDPEEIETSVPEFLREMKALMPSYLLNVADPETAIQFVDPEWKGGLPGTFLYDASGRLVFKHTGRVKTAELRAAIDKVTSGK